ncbi:histidine phosphatase family protein [Microbacterium hydrocarbonoxydans]|uniref:Probable phosphoglycerate mutase n=1 Tax=Microbacterium hydrocarbonoxydans TaxID=273678 RepID=A0A1H4M9G6_9MICO|nr:histidine phosphatase family protein [Microbacterium hydrocarbonoxydans]SEB79676.1 probable phosphoglycerate mutase [Microbacterium hydrocarbonoxydans]
MTLITLVRHGQTDWNLARRIQGSTDIPLNETGRADALTAAAALAGVTHHAIYSSPLLRASETAEIISAELGLGAPVVVPDVREREFGEGEGMLVSEYMEAYGGWRAAVPGAETLEDVAERSLRALDAVARDSRRRSTPLAESVVVVAHGGVIRALIDHVSGGTLPRSGDQIANGSAHRFEISQGTLRLLDQFVLV